MERTSCGEFLIRIDAISENGASDTKFPGLIRD
jgi:hypothetical protein